MDRFSFLFFNFKKYMCIYFYLIFWIIVFLNLKNQIVEVNIFNLLFHFFLFTFYYTSICIFIYKNMWYFRCLYDNNKNRYFINRYFINIYFLLLIIIYIIYLINIINVDSDSLPLPLNINIIEPTSTDLMKIKDVDLESIDLKIIKNKNNNGLLIFKPFHCFNDLPKFKFCKEDQIIFNPNIYKGLDKVYLSNLQFYLFDLFKFDNDLGLVHKLKKNLDLDLDLDLDLVVVPPINNVLNFATLLDIESFDSLGLPLDHPLRFMQSAPVIPLNELDYMTRIERVYWQHRWDLFNRSNAYFTGTFAERQNAWVIDYTEDPNYLVLDLGMSEPGMVSNYHWDLHYAKKNLYSGVHNDYVYVTDPIVYGLMDISENEYKSEIPRIRYIMWHHYWVNTSSVNNLVIFRVQSHIEHIYEECGTPDVTRIPLRVPVEYRD